MLAPEIEEIALANKSKAVFIKVDIEENDETAQDWDVECLPTIILLNKGEKSGEIKGSKLDKIKDFLVKNLEKM